MMAFDRAKSVMLQTWQHDLENEGFQRYFNNGVFLYFQPDYLVK